MLAGASKLKKMTFWRFEATCQILLHIMHMRTGTIIHQVQVTMPVVEMRRSHGGYCTARLLFGQWGGGHPPILHRRHVDRLREVRGFLELVFLNAAAL